MGTHWKKLSNPNFLGSWDFEPGEERTLTIDRILQDDVVDMENIKKDASATKKCIVAHFKGNSKPMILNKTNCKMMQSLFNTPIIEEWAGKSVIVKVEKVRAFGKLEEALRIKNQLPSASTPSPAPLICPDCKQEVKAIGEYSPGQIVAMNTKKHGRGLCGECSRKLKEAGSEVAPE